MNEYLLNITGIKNYGHALVEAGHFYADKDIEYEQQIGIHVGISTIESLQEMGLQATSCILIDDYNAVDIASGKNLDVIKSFGFLPQIIFREKECKPGALTILGELEEKKLVKDRKKTAEKYLKEGFIKLIKSDGKPTCALLDAALYLQKYEQFGGICVTVLSDSSDYRTQQGYTKQILKAAGKNIPILNVYFTEEGNISVDFDY